MLYCRRRFRSIADDPSPLFSRLIVAQTLCKAFTVGEHSRLAAFSPLAVVVDIFYTCSEITVKSQRLDLTAAKFLKSSPLNNLTSDSHLLQEDCKNQTSTPCSHFRGRSIHWSNQEAMAPPMVLMVGTGEYTTGFVSGAASTSDKKVGVVGLTRKPPSGFGQLL
jgi:hypothetical protein